MIKDCLRFLEQSWFGIAFAFAIFLLCCMFDLYATGTSFFDCFIHPSFLITHYCEKLSIALFISSFIFLTKNKAWSIALLFVFTLWIVAELIYMQFYGGMLIDGYSIKMSNNMAGFWSSIILSFQWKYLWLLLPLILLLFVVKKKKTKNYKYCLIFLTLSLLSHLSYSLYVNAFWKKDVTSRIPVATALNPIFSNHFDTASQQYSSTYSVFHSFGRAIIELFENDIPDVDKVILNKTIETYHIVNSPSLQKPSSKLIIILVESFESWAIREDITPNICRFLQRDNTLYAPFVKKQTLRGQSADGQMIVNTGLLPIRNGAVCYRFSNNKYPSLSELYSSTLIIVPGGINVWNQKQMCKAYHINNYIETSNDDSEIIREYMKKKNLYNYSLILTASSHAPFTMFAEKSSIGLPADMPQSMSDYLKSINYMDKCLGLLLSDIDNDSIMMNSTIVITGDHTIFSKEQRTTYTRYCQSSKELDFHVWNEYCPLIIYSPSIEKRKFIKEEVFQMDIFPTILNVIGCKDYYWKGVGINLLEQKKRIISETEAYKMSEDIFYSDYFNSK